jgi:hypothetical protein
MNKLRIFAAGMMLIMVGLLAGCGGGGSSSSTTKVSGVAATGTPITGTVYLKDSSNPAKELSQTINSDGSFSFDVSGMTAPFILKATGTANGQSYTLYSFAGSTGTANINPLSHLAVVQANGGADPATVYGAPASAKMEAIKAALANATSNIQTLFALALRDYGVANVNFISDTYVANHTGLDLFFDLISIQVSNGTLTVTNKLNSASIMVTTVGGTTLTGTIATSSLPTIPPNDSLFGTYTLSGFEITYSSGTTITSSSPSITSFSGTFMLNSDHTASQNVTVNGIPVNISATWSYNAVTKKFTFVSSSGATTVATLSFTDNVLTTTCPTSVFTEIDHWTKTSNQVTRAVGSALEQKMLSAAPLGNLAGTLLGGI